MKLSVIVPVYHEAERINDTVFHISAALTDIHHEIIVVDGDLEGSTVNHLNNETVEKIISDKGRGVQLHSGAEVASGNLFLFLHADTKLPKMAGSHLNTLYTQFSKTLCGAFDLQIDSNKRAFRVFEKISSIRSRLTRIPYGDQAIFISKEIYEKCGGFRSLPLMEDVDFMRRVKKMGIKLQFIDDPVMTSARKWKKSGIVKNTVSNWKILLLYYIGVSPKKLYRMYYR